MKEAGKIKLRGEITLLKNGVEVAKMHNLIQDSAGEIILRSLANLPTSLNVNEITINESVKKQITDTIINPEEVSIIFITQFSEEEFVGTIDTLQLGVADTTLFFSRKDDVDQEKDNLTVMEVQWKIILIINPL